MELLVLDAVLRARQLRIKGNKTGANVCHQRHEDKPVFNKKNARFGLTMVIPAANIASKMGDARNAFAVRSPISI